jgi:hypothetical protein
VDDELSHRTNLSGSAAEIDHDMPLSGSGHGQPHRAGRGIPAMIAVAAAVRVVLVIRRVEQLHIGGSVEGHLDDVAVVRVELVVKVIHRIPRFIPPLSPFLAGLLAPLRSRILMKKLGSNRAGLSARKDVLDGFLTRRAEE